jgi:hypothetical protein
MTITYTSISFQGPPKFTQIGIFCLKKTIWQPCLGSLLPQHSEATRSRTAGDEAYLSRLIWWQVGLALLWLLVPALPVRLTDRRARSSSPQTEQNSEGLCCE